MPPVERQKMARYKVSEAKLVQQLEQQVQALKLEQLEAELAPRRHMFLAYLICQNRLHYEVVPPLHAAWLEQLQQEQEQEQQQQQPGEGVGPEAPLLSPQQLEPWGGLVDVAAAASESTRMLLAASPSQLQAVLRMSIDEYVDSLGELFVRGSVLLELLRPDRWPGTADPVTAAAMAEARAKAAAGAKAAAAAAGVTAVTDLEAAGAGASAATAAAAAASWGQHLSEMLQLQEGGTMLSVLFRLHRMHEMFYISQLNLVTRKPGFSVSKEQVRAAAERLRLSREQILHLRALLGPYNRLHQAVSAESTALLQQLDAASPAAQEAAANTAATSSGSKGRTRGPSSSNSKGDDVSVKGSGGDRSASPAQAGEGSEGGNLEERLLQHVANRGRLIVLLCDFVWQLLTPYQLSQYYCGCWPVMSSYTGLADLAAELPLPEEDPPGAVLDVHQAEVRDHMARRNAALAAQLDWVLAHVNELLPV